MSAASPATSQVRRNAAAAPSRPASSHDRPAPHPFAFAEGDDEIRLNLVDIPVQQESLEIEGFRPTLLSRLLDLVAPLR